MGMFLSMSSVVGKTKNEVINILTNYATSGGGVLQQEDNTYIDVLSFLNDCTVKEENGNTSVLYPDGFLKWDACSEFISKELNAAVFSFHIHDGDFWMYVLYHDGVIVDKFNPIPDYWDSNISIEEIINWKGNAQVIIKYMPSVKASDIDRYLVRWDDENEEPAKAYPKDEFTQEDWQLTDFINKLNLPYPVDGGEPNKTLCENEMPGNDKRDDGNSESARTALANSTKARMITAIGILLSIHAIALIQMYGSDWEWWYELWEDLFYYDVSLLTVYYTITCIFGISIAISPKLWRLIVLLKLI